MQTGEHTIRSLQGYSPLMDKTPTKLSDLSIKSIEIVRSQGHPLAKYTSETQLNKYTGCNSTY